MSDEEPGGYQRDNEATFGVGTLKPCPHREIIVKEGELWKREGSVWDVYKRPTWEQPGDTVGTKRCMGCGNKL